MRHGRTLASRLRLRIPLILQRRNVATGTPDTESTSTPGGDPVCRNAAREQRDDRFGNHAVLPRRVDDYRSDGRIGPAQRCHRCHVARGRRHRTRLGRAFRASNVAVDSGQSAALGVRSDAGGDRHGSSLSPNQCHSSSSSECYLRVPARGAGVVLRFRRSVGTRPQRISRGRHNDTIVARTGMPRYFSFTTLTTLGYGDILPVSPVARSLATSEALFGQLYPAVMIARLISLEILGRRRADPE